MPLEYVGSGFERSETDYEELGSPTPCGWGSSPKNKNILSMDVRLALAQISEDLENNGYNKEANMLDMCLIKLSQYEETEIMEEEEEPRNVTPEEVMAMPNAKELIHHARNWVKDCQWEDDELIDEYDDYTILRGVNRHYQGGLTAFIDDSMLPM